MTFMTAEVGSCARRIGSKPTAGADTDALGTDALGTDALGTAPVRNLGAASMFLDSRLGPDETVLNYFGLPSPPNRPFLLLFLTTAKLHVVEVTADAHVATSWAHRDLVGIRARAGFVRLAYPSPDTPGALRCPTWYLGANPEDVIGFTRQLIVAWEAQAGTRFPRRMFPCAEVPELVQRTMSEMLPVARRSSTAVSASAASASAYVPPTTG